VIGSRALSHGIALVAALLSSAAPAAANGRFPESTQIAFAPNDANLVLLRTTFGLLISRDRGTTWQWVCEAAMGYSGVQDPMFAITPSGTILGTTLEGLRATRDLGCNWSFVGSFERRIFVDLATNPNDAKNIVAFASSFDRQDKDAGIVYFRSHVWESKDEAQTFQQLGEALDPSVLGSTVELARTDPNRLYVSAVRGAGKPNLQGVLLTSKDKGGSWQELALPLVGFENSMWIAAVDPLDADRVYVRTSGGPDRPSRLLLIEGSPDGGAQQIRELYASSGPLAAFALSPDGKRLYIGGAKEGILVASTADFAFTRRSTIEVQCLTLAPDGLWACSNEKFGFVAGLSKDDGVTFETKLRFCDIRSLGACGPGTGTYDSCTEPLATLRTGFGCENASSDGGEEDAGLAAAPSAPSYAAGGSGCRAAGSVPAAIAGATITGLLVLARLFRRRRD
jgi:photosystem II stability/assembly factor-like uncharacterized protein